jgi:hypothetical protein
MQNFIEMLRVIGRKPGFDLGSANQSITHLKTFTTGFQCGNAIQKLDTSILDTFHFWVHHHYHVPDGPRDWSATLLDVAKGDDALAFRLFFEHFEEFLKEREKIGDAAIKAHFIEMLAQMRKEET